MPDAAELEVRGILGKLVAGLLNVLTILAASVALLFLCTLLGGISALSLGAYTDDPLFQLGNAYAYNRHTIGCSPVMAIGTKSPMRSKQ